MTAWSERRPALPRLHLVTDDRVVAGDAFLATAGALLEAGGDRVALHLRAPAASGRALFVLAGELGEMARREGSLLLVNDRVDVARASGAGGVQLPARGLALADALRILGSKAVVGVSIHDAAHARTALAGGADFVLAGTIFASASHPGRPGSGLGWLSGIEEGGGRVIAIGGVTVERIAAVRGAGAHGAAVLGAVWNTAHPVDELHRFLRALYERDGID